MAEESWNQARLIPTSGIGGPDEQESRATSALLAVLSAVREFSSALLTPLGAPAGRAECFIEVPFDLAGKRVQPDGLIRVRRGQRTWSALVEVKTAKHELEVDQLERYLDVGRRDGFDALITISNQIPAAPGVHPTNVDRRKLKKIGLHHWPWSYILSTAILQKEHRGVSDTEQAWILGELIRYLEHSHSGAMEFHSMGSSWVSVRQAVNAGTLRASDPGVADVVEKFGALLRFASLRLGSRLGTDVVHLLSRKERAEPSLRANALQASLVSNNTLSGAITIPDTVGPVHLTADLRAGRVTAHVDTGAPNDRRNTARVNWLVRQLKDSPDTLRIETFVTNGRGPGHAELLGAVRADPQVICPAGTKDIRTFRIAMSADMGAKRDRGQGSFIDSVLTLLDTFYGDVIQKLKAWSASPPKLRSADVVPEGQSPAQSSTDLSSQDGPEPVTSLGTG